MSWTRVSGAAAIAAILAAGLIPAGGQNVDNMTEDEVSFNLKTNIKLCVRLFRGDINFFVVRAEVRRLPQPLHHGRDEDGLLPHEACQGKCIKYEL